MTPTQVKLLKQLLDSKRFAIYVKIDRISTLARKISIHNEKKRLAILETDHYNCNPFYLESHNLEIYRIPKSIQFFSAQGECNTLYFKGITWVCVKAEDVIAGDMLLDSQDVSSLYLAISKVVNGKIKAYIPNSNDSYKNLTYLRDVVAIRPVF